MVEETTGQRILIVEESATLRYILSKLAEKQGYQLLAVDSFEDAGEFIIESGTTIDGVILGWPNKENQYESMSFLLELDRILDSDLPVIILSNQVEPDILSWTDTRSLSAMAPWENYQEAIISLQDMLDPKSTMDVSDQTEYSSSLESIRVLFVDDSNSIVVYYRRLLMNAGYHVETASSVAQAYELALEGQFDIAIVDYFMPDENGFVLCQKLRDNPQTNKIRTAVITGTYNDEVIRECLQSGAVECMFKNEVEELFLARVAAMSRFIEIQRSVEQKNESLTAILSSVGEGVYGVDNDGRITFLNPASLRVLGHEDAEPLTGEYALEAFHVDTSDIVREDELHNAYEKGEILQGWETTFKHKTGKAIPVECTLYPLKVNGDKEGSVVAFRDISNQKMLEEKLRWQATHDHLTELYNRRFFETSLERELRHIQRRGVSSAIIYLDLDRFKYVNDILGHDAGDGLLVDISQTLTKALRKNDLVARIGGDEFAVILKNTDASLAVSLADGCREALSTLSVRHEEKSYHVQASIGVAVLDDGGMSAGDALADANIACHIAKRLGRNQTHLYKKSDDERNLMGTELGWSARLREALDNDGFVLHYQPIMEMSQVELNNLPAQDGLLWQQYSRTNPEHYNYEVLIRMSSETGDLFSPNSFIPTAERFGFMTEIDLWVIEHAIKDVIDCGSAKGKIRLSVNLSGNTLENEHAAIRIRRLLEKYEMPPDSLIFEITETSAIANIETANKFIAELSDIGCRFSLDDFGSGFCSFAQLKNIPSDFVKIDGQFVKSMARGSIDRAIVTAMNDVAHSLGRFTVAEYVESPEIMRLLKICGVDRVQGNYISKPLLELPHGNVVEFSEEKAKRAVD